MEQNELYAWESRCTQEEMPHCRAACPLQVDIRGFMERMAAGDTAGARKILERHMPLPGLLGRFCDHPCEAACIRGEHHPSPRSSRGLPCNPAKKSNGSLGGSLAVGSLERFCVSALPRQTKSPPMPRKNGSVAVVGDGMAGLTAVWDLGRKGFSVTLFHPDEQAGYGLVRRLSRQGARVEDTAQALEIELDFIKRGPVRFEHRPLDTTLLKQVLNDFDAVIVDTAVFPALAPNREELDPVTLTGSIPPGLPNDMAPGRLSFAGLTNEESTVRQAAQGRRAATTAERFLSGVSLTASRQEHDTFLSRLWTPLDGVIPASRPTVPDTGFSPDEAKAEASRCLRCQCLACVRECAYLTHYKAYPKSCARQIYNNGAIVKGQHLANSLINGCSLCGQCEVLCPDDFSMADLCLSARREMVERGYMPPSAHEFALEDMASANSPDCSLVWTEPDHPSPSHLFFPGCQLAAARHDQILTVYNHLRRHLKGGVGLALRCCGVPSRWAGREDLFAQEVKELCRQWEKLGRPRLIAACASCLKTLRESLPDINCVSLWEVLDRETPPAPGHCDLTLTIHDPCSARHDQGWQKSTRRLSERHGVTVQEPPLTGEATACCGYGGLTWNAQPVVADAMSAHRAAQLAHDGLASCIMCRDRLAAQGKACYHLLDILFPAGEDPAQSGRGLSERREGRAALKRRVLRELGGEDIPEPELSPPHLVYAPGLEEKLDGLHILKEDVRIVVRQAEADGSAFLDRRNGHRLASWRPVRVTYWVEYSPDPDGRQETFVIHNAYSHRMVVPGTGNADGVSRNDGFQPSFRPAEERSGAVRAAAVRRTDHEF